MPNDKWGIPFLYPTKKTAGLTGTGSGFFWQQNNDIHKDDDYEGSAMVRIGKEHDSSDFKVISTTTGEWQFPFTFDYDYEPALSMSGPTGHHTGGVSHGCQGFTYMINVHLDSNPPQFRFRKETYHVQYDNHPEGFWTSPSATGPIENSNVWKGLGWVRYNKKDGRGSGKDSVICEAWWNDNPTADITKWVMLKRVEDLGSGKTNWGVKATCDGDDYQVGTWSNIQFRFKSSGSDFSLHPLKPEPDDGPNINSIGGEDMSFSDSETRGYGYRRDMPRDIEMKCLFKWNGGGEGNCRFKNVSLREIDPTGAFDDSPGGDPNSGSDSPTEVVGLFNLNYDINVYRTSACSAGGSIQFYDSGRDTADNPPDGNSWVFHLVGTDGIARDRIGMVAYNNLSGLLNQPPLQEADFYLWKVGSPTGTLTVRIRNTNQTIKATMGTLDVSTLTTSPVLKQFINLSNTYIMVTGDMILAEYNDSSTNASNYVLISKRNSLVATQGNTRAIYIDPTPNPDTVVIHSDREIAGKLWN